MIAIERAVHTGLELARRSGASGAAAARAGRPPPRSRRRRRAPARAPRRRAAPRARGRARRRWPAAPARSPSGAPAAPHATPARSAQPDDPASLGGSQRTALPQAERQARHGGSARRRGQRDHERPRRPLEGEADPLGQLAVLGSRRLLGGDPAQRRARPRSPRRSRRLTAPPTHSPRSRCATPDRCIRTAGRPTPGAQAVRPRWPPRASPARRTGRRGGSWPGSCRAGIPRRRGRGRARGTRSSSDAVGGSPSVSQRITGRGSSAPTRGRPRAGDAGAGTRAAPRSCRAPGR